MIYTQGTISTVSGSAIVRGTGTKFKDNLNGIAPGQVIIIQSGSSNLLHMIQAVNSDTELVLADTVNVTLNNVTYQIQTTVPNSISDGVRHMCAINSNVIQFLQNMDKWMSQNGVVDVTLPNGQTVALQSIRALQAAMLDKNKNGADIPNKPEFVKNLGLVGTAELAKNALSKSANGADIPDKSAFVRNIGAVSANGGNYSSDFRFSQVTTSRLIIQSTAWWGGVSVYRPSGTFWRIEGGMDEDPFMLNFIDRNPDGSNRSVQTLPKGNGTLLSLGTNCWRDNNGFIKQGSPIIEIHPDGKFTTNDESEGATVTRLGLGHYKISGILGYNADGAWGVHGGISVPRDVNGNELVYVDDKVLPNGAIEIRVTHRQNAHMPARLQNRRMKSVDESTYYTDDEPCDLPAGTRLDIRVQMPADSAWNQQQRKSD